MSTASSAAADTARQRERGMTEVVDALIDEGRTLQHLRRVLEQQRQSIAENDTVAIEESVHHISRILLMVDETRRRRDEVVRMLAPDEVTGPAADRLEQVFGSPLPARLRETLGAVSATAVALRRDLQINNHIIERTLQAGDAFLQRLFANSEPAGVYAAESGADQSPAILVNRQV